MAKEEIKGNKKEEMSFREHLKDLRYRLILALIGLLVVFVVLFPFSSQIYEVLSEPLKSLLPAGSQMIATEVTSTFFAPLQLVIFLSFIIAMPFLLFQLWAFISPGLYKNEKAFVIPVFFLSIFLFYLGMAFAYFIVFPLLFSFFLSAGPDGIVPMTDISSYLSFTIKLLMAFGMVFEVPVITLFLIKSGVTDANSLKKKRVYIILGCFVIGMLVTPPDAISQTLIAIPMWLLFECGLLMSYILVAKKKETPSESPKE